MRIYVCMSHVMSRLTTNALQVSYFMTSAVLVQFICYVFTILNKYMSIYIYIYIYISSRIETSSFETTVQFFS